MSELTPIPVKNIAAAKKRTRIGTHQPIQAKAAPILKKLNAQTRQVPRKVVIAVALGGLLSLLGLAAVCFTDWLSIIEAVPLSASPDGGLALQEASQCVGAGLAASVFQQMLGLLTGNLGKIAGLSLLVASGACGIVKGDARILVQGVVGAGLIAATPTIIRTILGC
jgi:hypothetical protein